MIAIVTNPAPRKFGWWCEQCQDGENNLTKTKAAASSYRHNLDQHRRTKEEPNR